MSYRFNQLTGRVVKAAESLGQFKAVQETPELIYAHGVKFAKVEAQFAKPGKAGFGELDKTLLSRYKQYQTNDGTPIHLKGGTGDKILYFSTLLLCALGVEECFRFYYETAFPKKAEESE